MSSTEEYTQQDISKAAVFMARMQPYLMQGMTFQQAGEAVIARDLELVQVVSTARHPRSEEGQVIGRELAAQVYASIRR